MAWIKLETHIFDKLEIFEIAEDLGIDPDSVVGKCCRVWSWFDLNTVDGVTSSVTESLLDRYCGIAGFCKSMIKVGWMSKDFNGLSLPNYDRHNSQTAKNRALTAKRVSKHREKEISNAECNAVGNAVPLVKSLDREEKRREEKIKEKTKTISPPEGVDLNIWNDFVSHRKSKKSPITTTALKGIAKEAEKANISLQAALELCVMRGWTGFNASWLNEGSKSKPTKMQNLWNEIDNFGKPTLKTLEA